MRAAVAQPGNSDTKMAARRGFKGYEPGTRQRTGKADVKEDIVLQQLRDAWERFEILELIDFPSIGVGPPKGFLFKPPPFNTGQPDLDLSYKNAVKLVKNITFSSDDVERFGVFLFEYQEERYFSIKAGLFLSALINQGKDEEYKIRTSNLRFDHLGYKNKEKIIRIIGICGHHIGNKMRGGEIHIESEENIDIEETFHVSQSSILGGKIFHRGKTLVEK